MKRMFFFDFDDTLFSHATKCVPDSAKRALKQLHARGEYLVVATGRGPESVEFIRSEIGVPLDWMIVLNGQIIFQGEERIYERSITLPSFQKICSIAAERGFPYGGYYLHGELVNCIDDRVRQVWQDFRCPLPDEIPHFEKEHPIYQGHLYVTREEAEQHFSAFLPEYLINWSHPYLMNLISSETGKSQGIAYLLKEAGIDRANAYAFGDGFNDRDMLLSVGHGIAMENGTNALKEIAEYIAPPPDKDGIYKALLSYRLIT